MVTTWTLGNFKSVYETRTIKFAPLTIFAGANSSGKSTILQSILLTAQTLQNSVQSRSVILNGHIIRLGSFDDIASNASDEKGITVGFALTPSSGQDVPQAASIGMHPFYSKDMQENTDEISCVFVFGCEGSEGELEALQLQPNLLDTKVKIEGANFAGESEHEVHVTKSKLESSEKAKRHNLSELNLTLNDYSALAYDVQNAGGAIHRRRRYGMGVPSMGTPAGAVFGHFLPTGIALSYDTVEEKARNIMDIVLNPEEGSYVSGALKNQWAASITSEIKLEILDCIDKACTALFQSNQYSGVVVSRSLAALRTEFTLNAYSSLISRLPEEIKRVVVTVLAERSAIYIERLKGDRKPNYKLAFSPLVGPLDYATSYIRNYFSSQVKYLGPLRDEPKPVYPLAGTTDPKDVGFRGEHTAAVLDTHKHTFITYISPDDLLRLGEEPTPKVRPMLEAVTDWLTYLGVVAEVNTVDKGKLGHELKVSQKVGGASHDLTHVGVGVSQVLPILVLALLAETDSVLVFEQPELHLHPKVQTRLGDFFVSMSMLRKQCVVETHSEYLINRLRYLSAISDGDRVSKDTLIYFVEKIDGHSTYRPIQINEYGVIEDWPVGFFDENEQNAAALLKVSMMKRRNSKRN